MTFALASLAALALPLARHAAPVEHGRLGRAVACAAVLRMALMGAHITAASAIPSNENPEACTFTLASLPACANDVTTDGCAMRAQR
jgi:hypothetical protein